MTTTTHHLVIMAAGTGGHIMPGLAVAREMQRRGWSVSWLGTTLGMENRLVPPTGIPMDTLAFAGLRGKSWRQTLFGVICLLRALLSSLRFLRRRSAAAVLGMGGYVCFPGGLAAKLRGIPLMLINADASLLLSNRALLPVATRIGFGFEGAAAKATQRALVTGNPVRSEIEILPPPEERFAKRAGPLRVLVVGGSLGAQVLNQILPQALALIPEDQRPLIEHQTGLTHWEAVKSAYAQAQVDADIVPFIDDMAACLADCDLIVCRAGAITVAELCAAGVASILVPLVISTTAHQRDNAEFMAQHDAAIHLPQHDMTPEHLAHTLQTLSRERLLRMAMAARNLCRPKAAERVADEIEKMVKAK
jgi:UDP-N-acetylglucosamine--N-acetylmuramyl-(pentapeptide) pyrophosphoryl-undecaprenol N-acetylglucosamine transferase